MRDDHAVLGGKDVQPLALSPPIMCIGALQQGQLVGGATVSWIRGRCLGKAPRFFSSAASFLASDASMSSRALMVSGMFGEYEREDFSVVVKGRGQPPNRWKWEIYRAGRSSPIERHR